MKMKTTRTALPAKQAARAIMSFAQPSPAKPPPASPRPSNAVAAHAVRVASSPGSIDPRQMRYRGNRD